jgi:hypothetical protein
MALEKWKEDDGSWNSQVVVFVAVCGLLLLTGLYYVLTKDLNQLISEESLRVPHATTVSGGFASRSITGVLK